VSRLKLATTQTGQNHATDQDCGVDWRTTENEFGN